MAMLERGLEVGEDVDRSIMSKEVRTPVMGAKMFSQCLFGSNTFNIDFVEVRKG